MGSAKRFGLGVEVTLTDPHWRTPWLREWVRRGIPDVSRSGFAH